MQRNEIRINAIETVQVTILGHPDVTVPCRIRNISQSGMGIRVKQEIPIGKAVKVEWGENFLLGRVLRVEPGDAGFEVGLELLYASKWTEPVASVLASL